MENIFEPILDNNETIVKIIKPNKFAMYFKNMFYTVLFCLFMFGFACLGLAAAISEGEVASDKVGISILIALAIFVGLSVVICLIEWLFLNIYYKNVYYGYTNKRIVIRKGIFGVDYKSLDIKMIGASTVNVSLMDKLLKKNTGTLHFGSMASPINSTTTVNNFILSNVNDPYVLYKEIKNYISDSEDKKASTKKTTTKKENV